MHLDAVGGVAGDMFVAALIDAVPSLWIDCDRAIAAMAPPAAVNATVETYGDGTLSGRRFAVSGAHGSDDAAGTEPAHDHTHWRDIRQRLQTADLDDGVRDVAIAIFTRLAKAEAAVHSIAVDDVAFHEVGAWDSIVDIVASAAIVARLLPCRWSVGPLPRGRGLVRTAHGLLPVPAPAITRLIPPSGSAALNCSLLSEVIV